MSAIEGLIQGTDAVLSFYKNDWLPFLCSSDITVAITANKVAVRAAGDGSWKKYAYQDAEYAITLSGLLKFDEDNFTGWDLLANQMNFVNVMFRCSFDDENGNVRSMEGTVIVETSTLSISIGALVKNDFNLTGNGKLTVFDGLIPCPTIITGITVDGQEDSDGIVHVSYTYTGEAYQVKWRVDNTGDYTYTIADLTIDIPGLTVNGHSIEIIPICVNGFEGTGDTQDFVVTAALTCDSTCTGIVIDTPDGGRFSGLGPNVTLNIGGNAMFISPTITGSAPLYMYAWDDTSLFTILPITSPIPINNLSPGAHTLAVIPICTFSGGRQVYGQGGSFGFTLTSQSNQSVINYSYTNFPPNNSLNIYVNGILTISLNNANGSSSITVPTGATVKAVLSSSSQPLGSRDGTLVVTDNTTSTQLFNQSAASPFTKQFSFTANGDEFTINGVVSA